MPNGIFFTFANDSFFISSFAIIDKSLAFLTTVAIWRKNIRRKYIADSSYRPRPKRYSCKAKKGPTIKHFTVERALVLHCMYYGMYILYNPYTKKLSWMVPWYMHACIILMSSSWNFPVWAEPNYEVSEWSWDTLIFELKPSWQFRQHICQKITIFFTSFFPQVFIIRSFLSKKANFMIIYLKVFL